MKFKIVIFLFLLLLAMGTVSALSVTSPVSSTSYTGLIKLNATSGLILNIVNCTWTIGSADTSNTSVTRFYTNATARVGNALHYLNDTIDTATYEDDNSYFFNVMCCNYTGGVCEGASNNLTSVTIDNTKPRAPTGLITDAIYARTDSFALTGNVANANTSSCSVTWLTGEPSIPSPVVSYSGSTCSASVTDAMPGNFRYTMTATDGTNASTSEEVFIIVKDGKVPPPTSPETQKALAIAKKEAGTKYGSTEIVVFIIVGIVIYLLFFYRKKRRKN